MPEAAAVESFPIATADLVATGLFAGLTPCVRRDLLFAERTLRELQRTLSSQSEASWATDGVHLDVLPSGPAGISGHVESGDVAFLLDLYSEAEGEWTITADVRVESDALVDLGQDIVADVAMLTARTPEEAAAAFRTAASQLARAALGREPRAEAWRAS